MHTLPNGRKQNSIIAHTPNDTESSVATFEPVALVVIFNFLDIVTVARDCTLVCRSWTCLIHPQQKGGEEILWARCELFWMMLYNRDFKVISDHQSPSNSVYRTTRGRNIRRIVDTSIPDLRPIEQVSHRTLYIAHFQEAMKPIREARKLTVEICRILEDSLLATEASVPAAVLSCQHKLNVKTKDLFAFDFHLHHDFNCLCCNTHGFVRQYHPAYLRAPKLSTNYPFEQFAQEITVYEGGRVQGNSFSML